MPVFFSPPGFAGGSTTRDGAYRNRMRLPGEARGYRNAAALNGRTAAGKESALRGIASLNVHAAKPARG